LWVGVEVCSQPVRSGTAGFTPARPATIAGVSEREAQAAGAQMYYI
jgi:hypothetical protein